MRQEKRLITVDATQVCFRRVVDEQACDELRALRANEYEAHGFVTPVEARSLVHDQYDPSSRYFGAYALDGRLVGGSRLVLPSSAGLFALDEFGISDEGAALLAAVGEDNYVEVSALAVERSFGSPFTVSAGLYRAMVQDSLSELGIRSWIAVIDPALQRILQRLLRVPMTPLGPGREFGNRLRTPVLIDLVDFLDHVRVADPAEFEFFTDGLVIDLRSGVSSEGAALIESALGVST